MMSVISNDHLTYLSKVIIIPHDVIAIGRGDALCLVSGPLEAKKAAGGGLWMPFRTCVEMLLCASEIPI